MPEFGAYAPLAGTQPDDELLILDHHDDGESSAGTTKRITVEALLATAGGITPPPPVSPAPSKYAPLLYGAVWNWPWRFWPDRYGVLGNGRVVEDMAVSAGTLNEPSSASANFTSADVGRTILGWSGSQWYSVTITAVNSTSSVTVSAALPNSFAGKGAVIASDDVAGFNATVAAAVAYGQAGSQEAEVYIPPLLYGLATAATTSQAGNAQIPLPPITPGSALSVSLALTSDSVPAGPRHWLQTSRDLPGAVLCCMRTDGSLDTTFGPSCVIGGPVNGYGGGSQTFSNLRTMVKGLTIAAPYPSGYSGMVLRGVGQASVPDYSFMPLGATPAGGPWPQYVAGGPSTDQWTVGLWMPDVGNNDMADIGRYTCYGLEVGLVGSEHCTWATYRSMFNGFGLVPYNPAGGGSSCHGIDGGNYSCEDTSTPIGMPGTGYYSSASPIGVVIRKMDLESYVLPAVQDVNGLLTGFVRFGDNSVPGTYYGTSLISPQSGLKLVSYNQKAGTISGPNQPAAGGGTAWLNGYGTDVWVEANVSGGTFTSLSVDGVARPGAAGKSTYQFPLDAWHSYTPVLSGGTVTHVVMV